MLRLLDVRAGALSPVKPRSRGLLRVIARGGGAGQDSGDALRVLLVTDVLARVAELQGLQVLTELVLPDPSAQDVAAVEQVIGSLGIHPPASRVLPGEAGSTLGGPADVRVASGDRELGGGGERGEGYGALDAGLLLSAGPVRGGAAAADDPLALRLALLSRPYGQPAELGPAELAGAGSELRRWRDRVAEWAEGPSRPMPAEVAARARAAFDDDLDTPAAVAMLADLDSDDGVPPGAKFETFVFVDRVLGLELAREIGRPRT